LADSGDQGETLRDLIARLIDSAKAYMWAEVALAKKTIKVIANQAVPTAALAGAALLVAIAGLVVLVAALGVALATWLGLAGGLAAAGIFALLLAGLLVAIAIKRVSHLRKTAKDMFSE
jgi:hypothetical protein